MIAGLAAAASLPHQLDFLHSIVHVHDHDHDHHHREAGRRALVRERDCEKVG